MVHEMEEFEHYIYSDPKHFARLMRHSKNICEEALKMKHKVTINDFMN